MEESLHCPTITAVLTVYNRPETLLKQIECLRAQTVPPTDIWIWKNRGKQNYCIDLKDEHQDILIVESNVNLKYHGRFALAQLARTEYIFILDDDVFPQKKYIQNCLECMALSPGIMTTMGVILVEDTYVPHIKYGWRNRHNDKMKKVDIGCQSWFFRKEWLHYLWREEPITWDNGEDIQFSYLTKTYGNIQSYVPPQSENDQTMWGNDPLLGYKYGTDENATGKTRNHVTLRNKICKHYSKQGWKRVRHET